MKTLALILTLLFISCNKGDTSPIYYCLDFEQRNVGYVVIKRANSDLDTFRASTIFADDVACGFVPYIEVVSWDSVYIKYKVMHNERTLSDGTVRIFKSHQMNGVCDE